LHKYERERERYLRNNDEDKHPSLVSAEARKLIPGRRIFRTNLEGNKSLTL
jgi:hypothetical protein